MLATLAASVHAGQTPKCCRGQIPIAVVHREDFNGRQVWLGVYTAKRELDQDDRICLIPVTYRQDHDGAEKLEEEIKSGRAKIIIGPTDSGAYTGAFAKQDALREHQVPVISPVVTTAEGNQQDGWFFRTNVNNEQRITVLRDKLDPLWVTSLAVLYSDTGFGREAEEELRRDYGSDRPSVYLGSRFVEKSDSRREAVGRVLDVRPEAVGMFALAGELPHLFGQIDSRTQDVPYRPLYFTIVDARSHISPGSQRPLHFVSTIAEPISAGNPSEKLYEVGALAYDTTQAVLHVLANANSATFKPEIFRADFEHLLETQSPWTGRHTKMRFNNFENVAIPQVLEFDGTAVRKARNGGFWERVERKFGLVRLRFGRWPYIYAGVSLVLCALFTLVDVKRKYEGHFGKVLRHLWIYLLCGVHMLTLFVLLVFLGESGGIRYDNWAAVLALAVAPATLFRVTFLETEAGHSIGIGRIYEGILAWLNNRILNSRHWKLTPRIAVLAFYNSEEQMIQKLNAAYDRHEVNRRKQLREARGQRLEEASENTKGMERLLVRRRICATRLLRWYDWKQLYLSHVPSEFCMGLPAHPEIFIGAAADYCASDDDIRGAILEEIRPHLKPNSEREEEQALAEEIPADAKDLLGHEVYVALQFLVLNFKYKTHQFRLKGWLPPGYKDSMISRLQGPSRRSDRRGSSGGDDDSSGSAALSVTGANDRATEKKAGAD